MICALALVQMRRKFNAIWPCALCLAHAADKHHGEFLADEIHELRKREKEQGLEPDWEIDMFMKASAARGKRHSIMTDYVMRMLGLEVCPHTLRLNDRSESDCERPTRSSLDQPRGLFDRICRCKWPGQGHLHRQGVAP